MFLIKNKIKKIGGKRLLTALQIFSLSFFWISKPKNEMNPSINPIAATVNCKIKENVKLISLQ